MDLNTTMIPLIQRKPDSAALLQLARHVRSIPAKAFDWQHFADTNPEAGVSEHNCGSFGCVAGHAACIFPERLEISFRRVSIRRPEVRDGTLQWVPDERLSTWVNPHSFAAAFGLTDIEAEAIIFGYAIPGALDDIDIIQYQGEAAQEAACQRILQVLAIAEARYALHGQAPIDEDPEVVAALEGTGPADQEGRRRLPDEGRDRAGSTHAPHRTRDPQPVRA